MVRNLLLTVFIELSVAFILGQRKRELLNIALANSITNPIVVVVPVFFNIVRGVHARNIALGLLEIATVFIESIIYGKCNKNAKIKSLELSFWLNSASFLIGVLIDSL